VETDQIQKDVKHRAAKLYQFDQQRYLEREKAGFYFEL